MDKYDKLAQLQKLKDGGSISQEEFEIEKNKILNEKTKKKMPIWLCIIIALIITIGIIAFFGSMAENDFNQKSNKYAQNVKITPSDLSDNTYNNSNNTSTAYETEIISKWNKTLPLNNTNGLICAVYNIESDCLYLKYNLGICVVDENDIVTRYVEGNIQYSVIDFNISQAKKGDENYRYLTNTQFEALIGN